MCVCLGWAAYITRGSSEKMKTFSFHRMSCFGRNQNTAHNLQTKLTAWWRCTRSNLTETAFPRNDGTDEFDALPIIKIFIEKIPLFIQFIYYSFACYAIVALCVVVVIVAIDGPKMWIMKAKREKKKNFLPDRLSLSRVWQILNTKLLQIHGNSLASLGLRDAKRIEWRREKQQAFQSFYTISSGNSALARHISQIRTYTLALSPPVISCWI